MRISRKWRRARQFGKTASCKNRSISQPRSIVGQGALFQAAKQLAATATFLAVLTMQPVGWAMPENGQVTAGTGTITQSGKTMVVQQTSDKLAVNWPKFGIGKDETVIFNQPTAQSVALNRVIGTEASNIYGHLTANGKVFLLNPNGVLFAPGAEVNTEGLVASTLNMTDADFMSGKYRFTGNDLGNVVNQGTIAANGGYVVLAGAKVDNQGTITADQGNVVLAAGRSLTVDLSGQGKINVTVDTAAVNAVAANSGVIRADGGQVLMTAKAVSGVLDTVVNQTGIIQAYSLINKNGVIVLDGGENGVVNNSGDLDVSGRSAGQTGGTVKILGDKVAVSGSAVIDASGDQGGGTVLIGGNLQGKGSEPNASKTYVGANAVIKADAITSGNGGKVIVWADDSTQYYGSISARGGQNGGNGGQVETSGKNTLAMLGQVDASASKGQDGQWLLDPHNVDIQNATGIDVTQPGNNPFMSSTDSAIVNAGSIVTALNGGTDVIITTEGDGSEDGNITVSAPLAWSTSALLGLSAFKNINVNQAIQNTGSGNLGLQSKGVFFGSNGSISLATGTAYIDGQSHMDLGNIRAGDLIVSTSRGGISQANGTSLHIQNTADFTDDGFQDFENNSINLSSADNTFGGPVSAHILYADSCHDCGNFTLVSSGDVQLGKLDLTRGGISVTTPGNITQTANGFMKLDDEHSHTNVLNVGSGKNIILNSSDNAISDMTLNSGNTPLGTVVINNSRLDPNNPLDLKITLPQTIGSLSLTATGGGLKIAGMGADLSQVTEGGETVTTTVNVGSNPNIAASGAISYIIDDLDVPGKPLWYSLLTTFHVMPPNPNPTPSEPTLPSYTAAVTQAKTNAVNAFRIAGVAPGRPGMGMLELSPLPSVNTGNNGIADLVNNGLNLPQGLANGGTTPALQGAAQLTTQEMRMPGEKTEQTDQ